VPKLDDLAANMLRAQDDVPSGFTDTSLLGFETFLGRKCVPDNFLGLGLAVFRVMTPCGLVGRYQNFGRTRRLYTLSQRWRQQIKYTVP
jgi:hypothetical protein